MKKGWLKKQAKSTHQEVSLWTIEKKKAAKIDEIQFEYMNDFRTTKISKDYVYVDDNGVIKRDIIKTIKSEEGHKIVMYYLKNKEINS